MKAEASSLSDIPRHELIRAALDLGIERPERLAPEELHRQVRAASVEAKPASSEPSTGLFAVARNLLASVVERGLNLPDAARAIRDTVRPSPRHRPPLPTVTLAQIYLAQGYADRARRTLEQVIEREPDNYKALELHEKLAKPRPVSTGGESVGAEPSAESAGVNGIESEAEPESLVPSTRTSVTPGIASPSELWARPGQTTCGQRDALVVLDRSAEQTSPTEVQLYWELGTATKRRLEEGLEAVEVELVFYAPNNPAPRRLVLPVRGAVGRADVELVPCEAVRACLRSSAARRVLAVGLNLRAGNTPEAEPVEVFRPRSRAFYDDVVQRAWRQ